MAGTAYSMNSHTDTVRNVVVGLGMTGLSVARFLARRGQSVAVVDSRSAPPALGDLRAELPAVEVNLGPFTAGAFADADRLIVSPGVATAHPAIQAAAQRGAEVIGDIELFAREAQAPIIAITGSNGKSTVTTLVGQMAAADGREVRVGGNLGTPALDLLANNEPDLYVLELSSFQLETTRSLNASAAAVLNISEDHMDRYDSLAAYSAAKQRIFRYGPGRKPGFMVLNADDPAVAAMAEPGRAVIAFSLGSPRAGVDYGCRVVGDETWLCRGSERLIAAGELKLFGSHNRANALAALALAECGGIDRTVALDVLRAFEGLPHRMQWVAEHCGVAYFNDSKGTNVGATAAAVHGLDRPAVLILGGQGKSADFTALRPLIAGKARAIVLIGEDADRIEQALRGATAIYRADGLGQAVRLAAQQAQSGDCVVLSPACASQDMFRDYRHRGDVFVSLVRGLAT